MTDSSSGFSSDWLRQREPFDLAARSQALATGFQAALPVPGTRALRIVDLASGSGANFSALAPTLQVDQEWTLIDHDPVLLLAQRTEIGRWASQHGWPFHEDKDGTLSINAHAARWRVQGRQLDLARKLEDVDLGDCDGLVTTAFLDLVSAAWLDRLSTLLKRTPRPLLATLTVDGERTWTPSRPMDAWVSNAFLSHQGGDKGFGPSLGVQAAQGLAERLASAGFDVITQASNWHIGAGERDMLRALTEEAAAVATQVHPAHDTELATWLAQRQVDMKQGLLSIKVGHVDILAVPTAFLTQA